MKKRAESSLKVVEVQEKVKEQAETVKEQYLGWMEMSKNFLKESLKAMDMQFELWLAMQLGMIDFMKNVFEVNPAIKPFEHHLSPYAEHMEWRFPSRCRMVEARRGSQLKPQRLPDSLDLLGCQAP